MIAASVGAATSEISETMEMISQAALNEETGIAGVIELELPDGSVFTHEGEIDGPKAAEILDNFDLIMDYTAVRLTRELSCGNGTVVLRGAGVELTLCRRFTDRMPQEERVPLDPNLLSPVFIRRQALSPLPKNS